MPEAVIFGSLEPDVVYTERRAAYVVVINDGLVAMVESRQSYFLPGGGSLPGETPDESVVREVREELACDVRLISRIGEAIQYFYSATDDWHYRMTAAFFVGEFAGERAGEAEHDLDWLPIAEACQSCFHQCHAWAVKNA